MSRYGDIWVVLPSPWYSMVSGLYTAQENQKSLWGAIGVSVFPSREPDSAWPRMLHTLPVSWSTISPFWIRKESFFPYGIGPDVVVDVGHLHRLPVLQPLVSLFHSERCLQVC